MAEGSGVYFFLKYTVVVALLKAEEMLVMRASTNCLCKALYCFKMSSKMDPTSGASLSESRSPFSSSFILYNSRKN